MMSRETTGDRMIECKIMFSEMINENLRTRGNGIYRSQDKQVECSQDPDEKDRCSGSGLAARGARELSDSQIL